MPRSRTRSDTDSDYAPSPSPKKAKSKPTTKAAASTQSNSTTPSKTAKKKATTAEGNTTVAKKWPPIPPLPLLSPAETKLKYPHVTIINGKVYAPATGWTCPHPNCWHWLADSVPRKDKQRHRESHKDLCAGCNKPQCVASIKVHYARKHPGCESFVRFLAALTISALPWSSLRAQALRAYRGRGRVERGRGGFRVRVPRLRTEL